MSKKVSISGISFSSLASWVVSPGGSAAAAASQLLLSAANLPPIQLSHTAAAAESSGSMKILLLKVFYSRSLSSSDLQYSAWKFGPLQRNIALMPPLMALAAVCCCQWSAAASTTLWTHKARLSWRQHKKGDQPSQSATDQLEQWSLGLIAINPRYFQCSKSTHW